MQRRSEPFHSAVALSDAIAAHRAPPGCLRETGTIQGVADTLSLKEAAERVGVSADTLRRWAREGVIPEVDGSGEWTSAAVAHARIVARLRDRGHALEEIKTMLDRYLENPIDELPAAQRVHD